MGSTLLSPLLLMMALPAVRRAGAVAWVGLFWLAVALAGPSPSPASLAGSGDVPAGVWVMAPALSTDPSAQPSPAARAGADADAAWEVCAVDAMPAQPPLPLPADPALPEPLEVSPDVKVLAAGAAPRLECAAIAAVPVQAPARGLPAPYLDGLQRPPCEMRLRA